VRTKADGKLGSKTCGAIAKCDAPDWAQLITDVEDTQLDPPISKPKKKPD